MKKSILLGLIMLSAPIISVESNDSVPTIKLSTETENYFKNTILKSCKKYKKNDFYIDYYFKCFKDDFNRSRLNTYCETNLEQHIAKLDCNQNEVNTFKKMKAVDALPLHKHKISGIKDEIADFKKKNLSASF